MEFTTVGSMLLANLEDNPEKEAMVFRDQRYTYRDIGEKVDRLAEALLELGIKRGDKVALNLPNWPEFVYSFFAISKIGAIIVMLNTRYRSSEIKHILKDSDSVAVIAPVEFDGFSYLPMIEEMRADIPDLRHVIAVGDTGSASAATLNFDDLLARASGKPVPEAEIDPLEDLVMIMYTSGTTGSPKGAMITHHGLVKITESSAEPFNFTPDDVFLVLIPASHIMGLFCLCSVFFFHGKVILVDVFKAEPVLEIIQRERATVQYAVPTVYTLELAKAAGYDISSLRTGLIAGASVPAELVRRLLDMNYQVHVGYGMTETAGGLTSTTFNDDFIARTETSGRPQKGVQVKFVDDERRVLPQGRVGEIAVKSPGLMKGYYNHPEANATCFDAEGWYYTGDLGYMDERGYVRIAGRKKDMVIRGGFNIYPSEVEAHLFTNQAIEQVAIVGVPDPVMGEKTCACIIKKPGANLTDLDVKDFCRGQMADYKVPDYVRFVDSFPMTSTGKVYKIQLRQESIKELNLA